MKSCKDTSSGQQGYMYQITKEDMDVKMFHKKNKQKKSKFLVSKSLAVSSRRWLTTVQTIDTSAHLVQLPI